MDFLFNSVGAFLTATALLVAVLLVWAQLWVNTWKKYKDKLDKLRPSLIDNERKETDSWVSSSLAWIYLAIIFVLIAFSLTAYTSFTKQAKEIPQVATGFLFTSLFMTGVLVLQSFGSAFRKFLKGTPFDQPAFKIGRSECRKRLALSAAVLFVVGSGFVSFSITGLGRCPYLWIGVALLGVALFCFVKLLGCKTAECGLKRDN